MKEEHNHYFKPCPYDTLDVYRVITIFGVSDPCTQHALKKLLCSGVRGYKDQSKDIQDVIDTLERWKQMREEEAKTTSSEVVSPKVSKVNTDIDSPVENWYPDNSGEWIEYDGSGQPVEDGGNLWIEWNKGYMPLDARGRYVDLLLQVERDEREAIHNTGVYANNVDWSLGGNRYDIVAYRVVG